MRKSTLIALFSVLTLSVYAQNLYIQYDSKCMDKLEYKFVQSEASNVSYSVYRLNKSNTEKLFLETGVESVVIHKSIPGKLTKCSNINLDKNDLYDINRGKQKVYLCKKLDSGWAILPVGTASYMKTANQILDYMGPDYDFSADLSQSLGGINLSPSHESFMSSVYYAGSTTACQEESYLFKKSPNETCRDESTLNILPQVGLLQDMTSSGQQFELVSINNMPVCPSLEKKVVPLAISSEPKPETVPVEYSQPVVYEQPEIIQTIDTIAEVVNLLETSNVVVNSKSVKEPTKIDCSLTAGEGEHIVSAGESLYGIARRYGLTVTNLRSWNNLTGDVIHPCTVMKVTAPIVIEQPSMTVARTQDIPMSYSEEKVVVKKIECNIDATENEHVVQQGENLYSIARQYNLKVEQLKSWNNLKYDVLQPCSKLLVVAPKVEAKSVPISYSTVVKPKAVKVTPKSVKVLPKKAVVKVEKKEVKTAPKKEAIVYVKKESCMYIAAEGETVTELAQKFGVSEAEFRRFNNLRATDKIRAGQVLKKSNSPCFVEDELPKNYCIVATPQSEASKKATVVPQNYSVVVKPKSVTNVTVKKEEVPHEYSNITLPKPIKVKEPEVTAKSADLKARKYHVVKDSDTIFSIAKIYGISTEKLRTLNNLEPNEAIIIGQLLVLE